MVGGSPVLGLLALILFDPGAEACQCQSSYAPCNEVAVSDSVFIGTVESISPIFLSRWNLTSRASLQSLNEAYLDAQDHPSPAALSRLKVAYVSSFPDQGPEAKQRLQAAKTIFDVTSVFYSTLNSGMRVRFKVRTLFKHEEDGDDDVPKKPKTTQSDATNRDDDNDEDYLEVSTPFGDCGVDFQAGETYLVYADNDENSDLMSTTVCTRTRRLTDAGDDLPYLFYYKEQREQSTRIEGFTTADDRYQLDLDKMHDPTTMKGSVPGLVLELRSESLTRFTTSDSKGRFVFDGLAGGEYSLSAFEPGYPAKQGLLYSGLLAGPQTFSLEPKSCAL